MGDNGRVLKIALCLALGTLAVSGQTFTAVSVRAVPTTPGSRHRNENSDPKHLGVESSPHGLVLMAYGITSHQLEGEPSWFSSTLYSVRAVTAEPTSHQQKMVMLRAVLADRFGLKLRQKSRTAPVYQLEVAPKGPKFKPLPAGTGPSTNAHMSGNLFQGTFTSISGLMQVLNGAQGGRLSLDRPVVDATHLSGAYAIKFQTAVKIQTNAAGPATFSFPDLFRDIQSELGLNLVRGQAQETDYVVEHASKPGPD